MPSKPSLLLRWFRALLQQNNGVQLLRNLKRDGNIHTVVVRWMASMWQLHVLGTLAPCTEATKVSSLLSWWRWSMPITSFCGLMSDLMVHLPEDKPLPGDDVPVLYFIIGDNAFGINKTLMNPFSIRNMDFHERIFNYRLLRVRRVVGSRKCIWHSGTQVQSFADDHEPEASFTTSSDWDIQPLTTTWWT